MLKALIHSLVECIGWFFLFYLLLMPHWEWFNGRPALDLSSRVAVFAQGK